MLDDHTEDLTGAHTPTRGDTEKAEQQVRRFGRNSLTAGLILAPLTHLFCLGAAVATNNEWGNRDAQLFCVLGIITLMVASGGLIVIGGMERLHRPVRRRQHRSIEDAVRLRRTVEAGLAEHRGRFVDLAGLVGSLSGSLDAVDRRLDPVEKAIGSLAAHLPDTLQREHWMGFNEAVREGFTGEQTGTEGPRIRRSRHLGIAAVDMTDD